MAHYAEWQQRKQALKRRGFEEPALTDDEMPICAMKLGQLRVDVMPDAQHVLGFTNTWYARAVERAWDFELEPGLSIKLVTPDLFLATKLVAFRGRGHNDALQSRDIEDLINIVDGRPELAQEVPRSEWDIQHYIAEELGGLLVRDDFAYMVQSHAGDQDREDVIFERLETIMNAVGSADPGNRP